MWLRLGQYLRAKLIVMAIVGAITAGALALIGAPYSLLLGTVTGLGVAAPRIGPWLARIPIFASAALECWLTLGPAFGARVLIDDLKGFVISPFIEGDQLDIHPLLVLVAVLVGASLLGFIGAFVAVPAAAMAQVVADEVATPWRRRARSSWYGDARCDAPAWLPPGLDALSTRWRAEAERRRAMEYSSDQPASAGARASAGGVPCGNEARRAPV